MSREEFGQKKHQDVVNEMYQRAIAEKIGAETERLKPTMPIKIGGQTMMVSQPDYLKLKQLEVSAMGSLEKEYEYYKATTSTPMSLDDYMLQKNTWVQQYKYYAWQRIAQGLPVEEFDPWVKGQRRASAMSIDYAAEKAGATAGAGAQARSDVDVLGEKGYSDARKQATTELGKSIDYRTADPEEQKKMINERISSSYESMLKAQFGSENVVAGQKNGNPGWAIKMKDGSVTWRSMP